jgi:hypothetical protein
MKEETSFDPVAAATSTAAATATPEIQVKAVTDSTVLEQGRVFAEAVRQATPFADPGTREAGQAARFGREVTARSTGLSAETAKDQVLRARSLQSFASGANPAGKVKEIIAALDYRDLHAGVDPGMVNPPTQVAPNVADVRVAPDDACKRDLLFKVQTSDGMLLTVPGGQVKTGSGRHLYRSLVEMLDQPGHGKAGYGKTAYVDARFVNADGNPRVAEDAFTATEARNLAAKKLRLRGIRDLDARGEALLDNTRAHRVDGLDPVARRQLAELRDDIARAYRPRSVAARAVVGAAVAAATAAVVSLAVQFATTGEVDGGAVREAAGKATVAGVSSAVADAALYRAALSTGLSPEAARVAAQQGVAIGFCLLALGADVFSEMRSLAPGEASRADVVFGASAKAALDLLPMALGALGLAGVPLLVAAQLGGRWTLRRARAADAAVSSNIAEDFQQVARLDARLDVLVAASDEADRRHEGLMGRASAPPALKVVNL